MSAPSTLSANGTDPDVRWQIWLAATARALPYPPTPDLAGAVRAALRTQTAPAISGRPGRAPAVRRLRWAYALALGALLVIALLAVPGVRAGVLRWLQLGGVRIWLVATETPTAAPRATGTRSPATGTPVPSATPLSSVLDIAGETTLEEARARVSFPIRLPAYPAGLGQPDRVFVQDQGRGAAGTAVVLVWLALDDPEQARLVLYLLDSPAVADKLFYGVIKQTPPRVETTEVNGQPAIWTSGPYVLMTRLGSLQEYRLIEGHVLIWTDGVLTYRLESGLALAEAVRVAESLE